MSNSRTLAFSLLVGLAGLTGLTGACHHPKAAVAPHAPPTLAGDWREFWGVPGETDVTYHDEYRVALDGGQAVVTAISEDHADPITAVAVDGNQLDFVTHTSFDIHYHLKLDATGAGMDGTATTPDKVVPIHWERIER
jgi:hypothetical protein